MRDRLDSVNVTDISCAQENQAEPICLLNIVDNSSTARQSDTRPDEEAMINAAVPSLDIEGQIAKVDRADERRSFTRNGVSHDDYFSGGAIVFSDVKDQDKRIRTAYDMNGRVEGRCQDNADGSSNSEFKSDFGTFRVERSTRGLLTILEKDSLMDSWVPVDDSFARKFIVDEERKMFKAPIIAPRRA
ncbi:MAG: hypothetical protein K2X77_01615 [Candidatus Obscuribacterales bacterium]|jgi:hypothetical protein|nr:hypothetical protein [Candidatus Obscuribacterales bacterium]